MLIYVCITLFFKNNKNENDIKLLTKVFFSFICICICLCYFMYRFIPSTSRLIKKIFKEKLVDTPPPLLAGDVPATPQKLPTDTSND